jgi:hypothetical protein
MTLDDLGRLIQERSARGSKFQARARIKGCDSLDSLPAVRLINRDAYHNDAKRAGAGD